MLSFYNVQRTAYIFFSVYLTQVLLSQTFLQIFENAKEPCQSNFLTHNETRVSVKVKKLVSNINEYIATTLNLSIHKQNIFFIQACTYHLHSKETETILVPLSY